MDKENKQNKKKGGRIPATNADFSYHKSVPSDEILLLEDKFSSLGYHCYWATREKCAQSNYLLYDIRKTDKLRLFLRERNIKQEDWNAVMKYAAEELNLFDAPLLEQGYVFCMPLLQELENSGLFVERAKKAKDILNYVNLLRTGEEPLYLDFSREDNSTVIKIEKEKEDKSTGKNTIESIDNSGKPENTDGKPTGIYIDADDNFPF